MPVLGHMGQAQWAGLGRVQPGFGREARAAKVQLAALGRAQAAEHLQQLALAIARHASHADDLAGAQTQAHVLQRRHAVGMLQAQAGRLQAHLAGLDLQPFGPAQCDLAADHRFGERGLAPVGNRAGLDDLAGTHHRDRAAQAHHLAQLVRDEDQRRAQLLQPAQRDEELVGLLRRQHRGRFVEDQDPGAAVQGLQDLQPLQLAHRQVGHDGVKGHLQPGLGHQRLELGAHPGLGGRQEETAFGAEHDVFQAAQRVDQHEVLVHHANAQGDGLLGVGDLDRLTVDLEGSGIGVVVAVEDGHQRALAGAVFADETMHAAGRDVETDVAVGLDGAKALGNALKADSRRSHRDTAQNLQALSAM
mmetsp:Transcript_6590/g.27250  ORF Transcript_6590/g.27250 Transcript_6590/m.27250 type:complete len:361 (-) Transcript_6590:4200-5282(-)